MAGTGTAAPEVSALSAAQLLEHWQGHRRLTRRVIEAFPEDKLFSFSVGSMRPFAEMVLECLQMVVPVTQGVATGKWEWNKLSMPKSKAELLTLWDEASARLNETWSTIPAHRFAEIDTAFGQWKGSGVNTILYAIDNEIHHRGQAYVYLRGLGVELPHFWERD